MGNNIASSFVTSLRRSVSGTTLFSQSSANLPLFLDTLDIPGIPKAWVSFNGMKHAYNSSCSIYNKSVTVAGVSANLNTGEYTIDFIDGAFTNANYIVTGSVESNNSDPVSAATTFFIKGSGAGGTTQTTKRLRIQTVNSQSNINAFANRVNLVIYK